MMACIPWKPLTPRISGSSSSQSCRQTTAVLSNTTTKLLAKPGNFSLCTSQRVIVRGGIATRAVFTRNAPAIRESTAEEVTQRLEQHIASNQPNRHLIVMFTATWCGPCTLVAKELSKLAAFRPAGTVEVLMVDVDKDHNKQLATELGITSLPTLVFVGKDKSKSSICTIGNVSSKLVADVIDNKMHLCGADLKNRLRLS